MYRIARGDCLSELQNVADHSVHLIVSDLPYGSTNLSWDVTLPLIELWQHFERVLVPFAPVVMFGSQPFSTDLICSKREWFKYEMVWVKHRPTGFAHAPNMPMKLHENVLVFSSGTTNHASRSNHRMPYFPQGLTHLIGGPKLKPPRDIAACIRQQGAYMSSGLTNFPRSVLFYEAAQGVGHPTAKPIPLLEYLIKTYTRHGDVVLDPTMGSGSTGVAALRSGRTFVGIEKDETYFATAHDRLVAERETRTFADDFITWTSAAPGASENKYLARRGMQGDPATGSNSGITPAADTF